MRRRNVVSTAHMITASRICFIDRLSAYPKSTTRNQ
jgi:hypothetical protein